jgi:excisionase family DNA binding protein
VQPDPQQVVEPLLDSEDVGKILGRHPRTVLNLAAAGEIPCVRLGLRGVRFRPSDVQRFIDEHVIDASGVA